MPRIEIRLGKVGAGTLLRVKCFGSTLHWKPEVMKRVAVGESLKDAVVEAIEELPRKPTPTG